MNLNDQENGGCSIIQRLPERLEWGSLSQYAWERQTSGIDCSKSRDYVKALHLLAKNGGRWRPTDAHEIKSARRSLLKMTPDYTTEFVWIMAKYQASQKNDVEALLATPSMKRHLAPRRSRLAELLNSWPEDGDLRQVEPTLASRNLWLIQGNN